MKTYKDWIFRYYSEHEDGEPDGEIIQELIRCKDCTHQHTNTITGMKQCLLPNGYTPLGDDNDYCSYAERRGEG